MSTNIRNVSKENIISMKIKQVLDQNLFVIIVTLHRRRKKDISIN